MRLSINLASRPFVELRPLFARLRLLLGGLSLLALGLGLWLAALSRQADARNREMHALEARTQQFRDERARNEARMKQPANQAVLERSRFLNMLFAAKGFSWTGVLMDLERVLPAGVQVTSIDPVVTKEGDVSIRLRVSGDRDRAIQLVRNLERSERFVASRLAGETALNRDKANAIGVQNAALGANMAAGADAGVEFEIFSSYNPLPELHPASSASGPTASRLALGDTAPAMHHRRHAPAGVPAVVPALPQRPVARGGAR